EQRRRGRAGTAVRAGSLRAGNEVRVRAKPDDNRQHAASCLASPALRTTFPHREKGPHAPAYDRAGAIFHSRARNGASRHTPMASFTARSPSAQVSQGSVEPAKAIDQKIAVSAVALQVVATIGARHQLPARRRSNTVMSSSWATMKAVQEATAIRGVAIQIDSSTAMAKPTHATCRAARGPKRRLIRLLTRNATGWLNARQVRQSLIGYCTSTFEPSTTAPIASTASSSADRVSGAKRMEVFNGMATAGSNAGDGAAVREREAGIVSSRAVWRFTGRVRYRAPRTCRAVVTAPAGPSPRWRCAGSRAAVRPAVTDRRPGPQDRKSVG